MSEQYVVITHYKEMSPKFATHARGPYATLDDAMLAAGNLTRAWTNPQPGRWVIDFEFSTLTIQLLGESSQ